MRLPLRHPPPDHPAPRRRCAYLEELAEALVGVPLRPAAARIASRRSRGRFGNAVQWHLGLAAHDAQAELDWEDRIEVKLVTVWRRPSGEVTCDKLKVCDVGVDPWHKLANVLWVFVDRVTRVVVDAATFHLTGERIARLSRSWELDPHFGRPDLFVEAREQSGRASPAYYLAHHWFRSEALLPEAEGIFEFDAAWWNAQRDQHHRDPLLTIAREGPTTTCSRCAGPLHYAEAELGARGWAPAHHGMPLRGACAISGHFVVDPRRLRYGGVQTADEFCAGLESRVEPSRVWRVADRVLEPDDHLHQA